MGHASKLVSVAILAIAAGALNLSDPVPAFAQTNQITPTLTVRVDTTNANVRAVRALVTGYLNSHPDSLYDNPYWSETEKRQRAEPYSARAWIYSFPAVPRAFPPRILSIEKEGEYYCCRILYYAENLDSAYAATNPWALQRLYAAQENGTWKLFDPVRVVTKDWEHTKIGQVEYVYPRAHVFDRPLADSTAHLADSLATLFGRPLDFVIEFYVARSLDELNGVVGLDFTLNVSAGRSITPNHMVLTSTGREWYPHELVHAVLNDRGIHPILQEGVATLIGGSGEKSFTELVRSLQTAWETEDSLTVDDFLRQMYQAGSFMHYYALGAVLCRAALDKGGVDALRKLLFSGATDDDLLRAIESTLGVKPSELTRFVRAKTREYAGR